MERATTLELATFSLGILFTARFICTTYKTAQRKIKVHAERDFEQSLRLDPSLKAALKNRINKVAPAPKR